MLTRRGFLRKATMVAGAALVALGLRDVPGAKAKDLHTLWLDVTPTKAIATVVGRGPIVPRLDHLGMTVDLHEGLGTHTGPGEWPDIWPMREPTEQEYEKWRADLEDMCDQISPWLEDCVEAAAETARQVADLFELMVPNA